MECARDSELRATWDRLALIFLGEPREGLEDEYQKVAARELGRLAALCRDQEHEDE